MVERAPVAVDAMGGDDAPASIVAGARLAWEQFGVRSLLVGDPDAMGDIGDLAVKPAYEVVEMGADPASSIRRLKDSSIVRGAEAVRDGEASSLLSAGNTGAAMAASLLRIGRIRGVARPGIAVPLPVWDKSPCTLIDCGANADAPAEWLVQFARMGAAYARHRFNLDRARVGVLTIGEEAGKGNAVVKEACSLLEEPEWAEACGATYVGNIEGNDLMRGVADVVVCDGFTGNVALKSMEGFHDVLEETMRLCVSGPEFNQCRSDLDGAIARAFNTFNSRMTGAAMLLGTKGVTLISHGSASAQTIANAIRTADQLAAEGVVDEIRSSVV